MSDNSKIEWCTTTWNPITGCSPISEGCENCYAKRMAIRLRGRCGYSGDDPFAVRFHENRLAQPLRWRKPRRIFVCSMGDLFHTQVKAEWIWNVFGVMLECPQHTFMVLTKRPRRMASCLREMCQASGKDLPPNCWLGVTAENQQRADERIPVLLRIPASVRFVSVEPMLGSVDLMRAHFPHGGYEEGTKISGVNWCICGGETGPGARRFEGAWGKGLAWQCQEAGIPFFFKKPGSNYSCEERSNVEQGNWMRREFPT